MKTEQLEIMENRFSLNCSYYINKFTTLEGLLIHIRESGQDPNYVIIKNGKSFGLTAAEALGL
jgi:hypothetical protein